ncbi:alpha-N-acetylglucosaminidase [Sabulilitoribacter arenilitoris]|uniref:Alpha-N-acetylglucosaminidase n=1 Tax=Wocania arenilitoris TaxID=2044858 RepID=A0AAE3EN88_9FLAO|nr:alpha-N-acetylglucosaminidase [Wocania arenilitoris]MCF7567269.1 alpha-N-acetylglucosaminidase [Wocania arenilitoris]
MRKIIQPVKTVFILIISMYMLNCTSNTQKIKNNTDPAQQVISRIVGEDNIDKFEFNLDSNLHQSYSVKVEDNKVHVSASSQVALCRGAYDYLSNACNSIVSWSGNNIRIPETLPDYSRTVKSPYKYNYYFNIVTHGYSTTYWDWVRWEKEIDWMSVHGINMPLLPGAHEAILQRVFRKLGLSKQEIDSYFTGPAHFPWNKMGNITAWDGKIPDAFYEKQIQLNHKILNRVNKLDMHPIVPAFAGFVPSSIKRLFPEEKIRELSWGGFAKDYHTYILEPGSDLFLKIGEMYIKEYEKEFGKQEFYLADSFNEMDVPLSEDSTTALKELSAYGESVYSSIEKANPDAVWVMQGWTFPYQKKDGKLFWTAERLHALISKVPDDKLMILDLANEYNRLWWKSDPSWKMYSGFFGKMWIYSFIPNMGGKTAMNGRLDLYAKMPSEALKYNKKGNLVGFGFAPEGIENNEIIYELLSDIGWTSEEIDLDKWVEKYATRRYGACPPNMKKAYNHFNNSFFGSFTDHPRNTYQFRPDTKSRGTVNKSDEIRQGLALFLSCKDEIKNNELYEIDVIEITCQYLGLKADELLVEFQETGENNMASLSEALQIMSNIDRLLESHPSWKLKIWTDYAKKWGTTQEEEVYYQSNAKRLITTWGGGVNEYAAKTWSGLIRDYYIPRWKLYYEAKANNTNFDILEWEEQWIKSTGISEVKPFNKPIEMAIKLFNDQKNKR